MMPLTPEPPSLAERLRDLISDQIMELPEEIAPLDNLFELGFESMAFMQLILLLEQELSVTIGPEDLAKEHFQSLSAIADLIARKQAVVSMS